MSPVIITSQKREPEENLDVEKLLVNEEGNPSIEAQVISAFLGEVEWSGLMDELLADEETRGLIKISEAKAKPIAGVEEDDTREGSVVICDEDDADGEFYVVYEMSGETAAEYVDVDDLVEMFDYHLSNELPQDTLEDKLRLAAFGVIEIDEDDLDERFKKGDFRKIHKAGGKDQVARMLIAMMKKEVINRADKAGTGYKGGDYKKNPAGYSTGTAKGKKKVKMYKKKFAAKIAQTAKKAKKAIKIAGKKGKAGAKGGGKKQIAASVEGPAATPLQEGTRLSEGASIAAATLKTMTGGTSRTLTEQEAQKK